MGKGHKPICLGPGYASQFEDEAVAEAYYARPPHPPDAVAHVASLQHSGPGRVLDLGCGTGDLTIPLAELAERIDAVEPSEAMLSAARRRPAASTSRISWHHVAAEHFGFSGTYDLVVAADSLHWMDLEVVVPAVARVLHHEGYLAIVGRGRSLPPTLRSSLRELIPRYSTNQHYESYDVVELLKHAGLFEEAGRKAFRMPFAQTVDDFVESIHSQNGFSRDRMVEGAAAAFDDAVRSAAARHVRDGALRFEVHGTVVWGHPLGSVVSSNA